MTKNKIQDLRNHLFLALEKLHDNDIDVNTAMAIAKIGQVVIESARVENQYQKIMDSNKRSVFIEGTSKDNEVNLIK
jgi:hypothetical protein